MDKCPKCGESDLDWLTLIEVGRIRYRISEADPKRIIVQHQEDEIDRTVVHCERCGHEWEIDGLEVDYH